MAARAVPFLSFTPVARWREKGDAADDAVGGRLGVRVVVFDTKLELLGCAC